MKRNLNEGIWDGVVTTSCEHQAIHKGVHFSVSDIDTNVDISTPKYYRFTTANSDIDCHFTFSVSASSAIKVEFFENPTLTGAGTSLAVNNNNRGSSNTASLTAAYGCTTSSDGTRLYVNILGTIATNPTSRGGGGIERDNEFELKKNEDYIIKITAIYDDTYVSILTNHYEIYE